MNFPRLQGLYSRFFLIFAREMEIYVELILNGGIKIK